ncbi:peptide-N4-(N-acetyl-beta-glucosaminyl)asparagine amidase A [Histoplasma capsulatum var. duboisii H88]|uniref:Peptide-N4-(N-acetyl-beta-glucosaminyl)asparagine amidase A n=1 Tax=Ajellomyces capsulatus (strain H88) TaxID=544711 RepID=F0U9V8_AJEC8|nr:peptide-N4-(N-acetyl-beta-glucosaminyl)asparagine amidase A [Histoplasma capsulatum var. duboisii H88]QSS48973.1 peptide-N4-(N-acetyl-beta- glucosaminyl)asparagine amidase A [Histoplasma capsulatum var. duboisii H88]
MGAKRQGLKNLAGVQDLNRNNTSFCRRPTYALCVLTVLFMLFYRGHASPNPVSPDEGILQLNATQLRVFQVYKPVPDEPSHEIPGGCNAKTLLMRHEFGSSYGHPFVGNYVPPRCDFDTVIMTMTVTSKGRQFDRLALMFLGDTEVFRTSTAEPTAKGIIWTYVKDMSLYKALWAKPQKLIFDLGNLINDKYTGPFDVTLTAKFSLKFHEIRAADIILPISARRSGADSPSGFHIPDDNATVTHIIPPDVSRATVSISACGQSTEEFWYSNVLSSDVLTFNKTAGPLYGYSSFREIQLFIDDQMAGVVWPFPIIFTGGISPGFWKPIVGIDAFDLREPEIDITPFLPVLADGQSHSFTIKVVGLGDVENGIAEISETVGSYWVVTGKIFIYLDGERGLVDQSTINRRGDLVPVVSTKFGSDISHEWRQNPTTGMNETLSHTIRISRSLSVTSPSSQWTQSLSFSNSGSFSEQGQTQLIKQVTDATSESLDLMGEKDLVISRVASSYPLEVCSTYQSNPNGLEINASLSRGLQFSYQSDVSYYSPYTLTTGSSEYDARQFGKATYRSMSKGSSSSTGDTLEIFKEKSAGATFDVRIRAVNGTVVKEDEQPLALNQWLNEDVLAGRGSIKAILGRGPGKANIERSSSGRQHHVCMDGHPCPYLKQGVQTLRADCSSPVIPRSQKPGPS